jgi:hypothetical protein
MTVTNPQISPASSRTPDSVRTWRRLQEKGTQRTTAGTYARMEPARGSNSYTSIRRARSSSVKIRERLAYSLAIEVAEHFIRRMWQPRIMRKATLPRLDDSETYEQYRERIARAELVEQAKKMKRKTTNDTAPSNFHLVGKRCSIRSKPDTGVDQQGHQTPTPEYALRGRHLLGAGQ